MPSSKTKPESITCRLSCINQYTKNKAFKIRNSGKIKVNTESNGNNFGAKKGKT